MNETVRAPALTSEDQAALTRALDEVNLGAVRLHRLGIARGLVIAAAEADRRGLAEFARALRNVAQIERLQEAP